MSNENLRHFNILVTQLEGGALNEQLSEAVRQCVSEISDACIDRAGTHSASLTLKLNFKMNHKDKIVEVEADLGTKLPKAPRGRAGLFWADADGNLLQENPRQMSLMDELNAKRIKDAENAGNTQRYSE